MNVQSISINSLGKAFLLLTLAVGMIFSFSSIWMHRGHTNLNTAISLYADVVNQKTQILSDLRANMGYGGAIHQFKNYLVRQGSQTIPKIQQIFSAIFESIKQYHALGTNALEQKALQDIAALMTRYQEALTIVQVLTKAGVTIKNIDQSVRINDQPGVLALLQLDQENAAQRQTHVHNIASQVHTLDWMNTLSLVLNMALLMLLFFGLSWFIRQRLLAPIAHINQAFAGVNLTTISQNRIPVSSLGKDELLDLATTINRFLAINQDHLSQKIDADLRYYRSDQIIQAFPDLIVILDQALTVVNFNRSFSALIGVPPNTLMGQSFKTFFDAPSYDSIEPFLQQGLLGAKNKDEVWLSFEREVKHFYAMTYLPLLTAKGDVEHLVFIAHDTTARKLAEDDVKVSEEKFRTVFENLAEGIITTNKQGTVITANTATLNMFGYESAQLLGNNVRILLPKSEQEKHLHTERMLSQVQNLQGRRQSGEIFPLELNVSTMEVQGKQLFVGIMHDATTRIQTEQALKQAEEHTRLLLDTAGEGLLGIDLAGQATFANQAACRMLGYASDELVGRALHALIHHTHANGEVYLGHECRMCAAFAMNKVFHVTDEVLWHKDGTSFPVEYTSTPIKKNDQSVGAVVTFTDISERRKVEEDLQAAVIEADNANQAKSEFLSNMSHELRTPLNSILGFAQLLETDRRSPLTDKQKMSLGYVIKGGKHLLRLISDILDLAKIESGHMPFDFTQFGLAHFLADCMPMMSSLAQRHNITLEKGVFEPVQIRADFTRTKQVFFNLVSNAIKYNQENGRVTVHTQVRDDLVRISVTDTGFGIAASDRDNLFLPFNRLNNNAEIEGTGIGLALSKEYVLHMQGHIGFESALGEGSTFWFELPLTDGTPVPEQPMEEALAELPVVEKGYTLLYIEDNPNNLKFMELLFEPENYQLISAHTAELGITMVLDYHPDLILMDINLPGMDGFEALDKLKRNPQTQDIPVIALSADAMASTVQLGHASGFADYLTKPVDINVLLKAVAKHLMPQKDTQD